ADTQAVTVEAVQAAIPEDAALLEFAVYRPFDPRAKRTAEAFGPPHYAAYVLRRGEAPVGLDLGDTDAIDHAIGDLRTALRSPNSVDVKSRGSVLYQAVMAPLRGAVGNATHLVISPDGALNLVPFEALVDERGAYLIERYETSYVTSGRDLLRMQVGHQTMNPPVIVADPFFVKATSKTR